MAMPQDAGAAALIDVPRRWGEGVDLEAIQELDVPDEDMIKAVSEHRADLEAIAEHDKAAHPPPALWQGQALPPAHKGRRQSRSRADQ